MLIRFYFKRYFNFWDQLANFHPVFGTGSSPVSAFRLSVWSCLSAFPSCPDSLAPRFYTYVLPDRPRSVLCSLVERVSPGQTRSEQEPLRLF